MKLIHCADLHLDAKQTANLTPEQARQRGGELCTTFLRLVNYAREEGVTAVLIGGDLFDTGRVTRRTVDLLLDGIAEAPEVDFLYLRGNHDHEAEPFAGRQLPSNLKGFSNQWKSYRYGAVVVTGLELDGSNDSSFYDGLTLSPADCNIVLLHGQISSTKGEEQICLPALAGKYIDYLALGHIHSCQTGTLDARGTYCYSGCLEGRGFDECGEKGFVLLKTTPSGGLHTTFVPFARRTLHQVEVDITGCTTVAEQLRAIRSGLGEIPRKDLVKVVLTGSCALEGQRDLRYLQDTLAEAYYCVKVEDHSRLRLSLEDCADQHSLKGSFVRQVLEENLPEEERDTILRWGIQALNGEEIDG